MLYYLVSVIDSTGHQSKSTYSRHPYLSEEEMKSGFILGLYSWVDTGFGGKHAYIDEFVEVKGVNITGFTSTLVSIDKFTIDSVLCAIDKEDGTMVFIEHNNNIYMEEIMIDYLDKPIQCEYNDARINLSSKVYDPNNNNAQSINFPDGTSTPVDFYGILPCIALRKSTKYDIGNCEQIALPSKFDWYPYGKGGSFPKVEDPSNDIDSVMESFEGTYTISAEISFLSLGAMILNTPILHQSNNMAKDKRDYEDMYFTVSAVKAKYFT